MVAENREDTQQTGTQDTHIRLIVQEVLHEVARSEQSKAEPAYKAELLEERKRREQLERRVNELIQENQRSRMRAEEAERSAAIRAELQRLGVTKVDLGYRAVKDDVCRSEDGRLVARTKKGEVGLQDYMAEFVSENPELLPARMVGGSGAAATQRSLPQGGEAVNLEQIRPGMSVEESERVRREVARVASQTLRGI